MACLTKEAKESQAWKDLVDKYGEKKSTIAYFRHLKTDQAGVKGEIPTVAQAYQHIHGESMPGMHAGAVGAAPGVGAAGELVEGAQSLADKAWARMKDNRPESQVTFKALGKMLNPAHWLTPEQHSALMGVLGDRNQAMATAQILINRLVKEAGTSKLTWEQQLAVMDAHQHGRGQATPELQALSDFVQGLEDTAYLEREMSAEQKLAYLENHITQRWVVPPTLGENIGTEVGREGSGWHLGDWLKHGENGYGRVTGYDTDTNTFTVHDPLTDKVHEIDGGDAKHVPMDDLQNWSKAHPRAKAALAGKRPLLGPKTAFNMRIFSNYKVGIAHGGIPLTMDLAANAMLDYSDAMKFKTGMSMIREAKEQGWAKAFRAGHNPPHGWTTVDPAIASLYLHGAREVPVGTTYYWEANIGRALNNFLSTDYLREGVINGQTNIAARLGTFLKSSKNVYTKVELSLSLFHPTFISLQAANSQIALGMRKVVNVAGNHFVGALFGKEGLSFEEAGKAAKEGMSDIVGGALVAPAARRAFGIGADMQKILASPEAYFASPEGQAFAKRYGDGGQDIVNAMFKSGIKVWSPSDYKNANLHQWLTDMRREGAVKGTLKHPVMALERGMEAAMSPVFDVYIPNVKAGMFFQDYSTALVERARWIQERAKSYSARGMAGGERLAKEELGRQIAQSIENRFGEVNYDTFFWNNTFRGAVQTTFRSASWSIGTWREFVASVAGQGKEIGQAIQDKRVPVLHQSTAWLIAVSLQTAAMGAIIMKVRTGKYPWDDPEAKRGVKGWVGRRMLNFVVPQVDPNDPTKRISLPTYLREPISLWHDPIQYGKNKLAGSYGRFIEDLQNRNFYGEQIWASGDNPGWGALKLAAHLIPTPIGIASGLAQKRSGGSWLDAALSEVGLTQAPAYLSLTKAQVIINDYRDKVAPKGAKTPETFNLGKAKSSVIRDFKAGKLTGDEAKAALEKAGVNYDTYYPSFVKAVLSDPLALSFSYITQPSSGGAAVDVQWRAYKAMKPAEREKTVFLGGQENGALWTITQVMADRLNKAYDKAQTTEEQAKIQAMYNELCKLNP